jgi:acyl-CoA synthetase (AMP-forming)/AMP-acid ligase II
MTHGVAFALTLECYGDAIAVVTADERVSYRELAGRADRFAEQLGEIPRLVVVEGSNRLEPLVAYLGALRAGHPVILTAPGGDTQGSLLSTYGPDFRFVGAETGFTLVDCSQAPRQFHPALAVMLSTSGTTGSAKLVRLSGGAVQANAASIAEYLGITSGDKAITSLPFHYSYGLSVVNSHLHRGATILLTDRSVIDAQFWSMAEAEGATSLAGVPYTYELLERSGFRDHAPPTLRTLTQAGGRLPQDLVATYAAWARNRGARFFVMYGQTEATARMAYLPPELVEENPGAIGIAIPGGAFRLVDEAGAVIGEPDTVGELIYTGPNVMMGYAETAADLAKGREIDELRTGDLAQRDGRGLYRIAGRKTRFAKLFGLRINLDDVEAVVLKHGVRGAAASNDRTICIGVIAPCATEAIRDHLAASFKLPAESFIVIAYADLPTLATGKVDYRSILADGQALAAAQEQATGGAGLQKSERLAAAFQRAFSRHAESHETFVSMGGDSLNYIVLSLEVEEALGFLPPVWEERTLGELQAMAPRQDASTLRGFKPVDSEVLIRALAITAVVVNHVSSFVIGGGAEVLILLAGYNMAKYQRLHFFEGKGPAILGSFVLRIIVPYYVLLLAYELIKQQVDLPSLLMVSNYFGRTASLIEPFWFLEALLQCTVVVVLIMAIRPIRAYAERDPWRFGLALLGAALIVKVAVASVLEMGQLMNRTADAVFFLLAFGWSVQQATDRPRRLLMTVIAAAFAAMDANPVAIWLRTAHPGDISHAIWLLGASLLIIWTPRIPIPKVIHPGVTTIAAAAFYIYLTHVIPVEVIYWMMGVHSVAINLGASLAVGIGVWAIFRRLEFSPLQYAVKLISVRVSRLRA